MGAEGGGQRLREVPRYKFGWRHPDTVTLADVQKSVTAQHDCRMKDITSGAQTGDFDAFPSDVTSLVIKHESGVFGLLACLYT